MAQETNEKLPKSFKDTLNLPHTDFPIRSNPAFEDPALLQRWQNQDLYTKSFNANEGSPKFILHDGPPYANGPIHLGHAYNKILKDIIGKSQRMMGYHVPITPGWDCHGLPIELKVTQEKPGLNKDQLIQACRDYALHWIGVQKAQFKELGVLMDWENPYVTMSKSYEAATVRAFGLLVEYGFVERKNKTVPWCFHDQTVLASAEIEYKDRKDPSIYVAFDLKESDAKMLFPQVKDKVSLIVWTTTPWTLPLNQAVLARSTAEYVLIDLKGRYGIVGAQVADKLCGLLHSEKIIIDQFKGNKLAGKTVYHPFISKEVPIIFDDSVGLDEGTAFVHCAPGCGPLDYEIGVKNNLDIYSPLSADGKYTDLIEPSELAGMSVVDAQGWVIKKVQELNTLIYKGSISHSYPHCWRCRNGLIFRATPQWFFDLERQNIKQDVLNALDTISFTPEQSKSFLRATVENRWEWCLSRQRVWGTPIPALICENCDYGYLDAKIVEKVAQGIQEEGIEYWHRVPVKELIQTLHCPRCKSEAFIKEYDILDVWFDAGISHYAVLYKNPDLHFPANLYLEGVDQHRGWFQSSIIMSMVIEKKPCTRGFLTHGYTVDEKGQKMSKSLGNGVEPQDIIKEMGTDGLRLWVSSIGNEGDVVVSKTLLRNVSEVQRKIRNTARFLLSNLYDFDFKKDVLQPEQLLPLDHYALTTLNTLNASIIKAYNDYTVTTVFHELSQYCAVELSAFYLDIIKDRLYCDGASSMSRRSAQTVLYYMLDTLTRLIAPILSFTAEQISDHYQKDKAASIHLQPFVDPQLLHDVCFPKGVQLWPDIIEIQKGRLINLAYDIQEAQKEYLYDLQWQTLRDIRSVLLKALEIEREKGIIKHSLEAQLTVFIDLNVPKFEPLKDLFSYMSSRGKSPELFFKEFLIVSQFHLVDIREGLATTTDESIAARVEFAKGTKCPRCWNYDTTLNKDHLCARCERVLATEV